MSELNQKQEISIKKASLIMAAGKYVQVFLALVGTAIMSRILTPEDFGIVAILTAFSLVFVYMTSTGFSSYVVQNPQLTKEHTDNLFSATIYLGIVVAIFFAIISIPISWFLGDSIYISLGTIMSVYLFFLIICMVPNGIMFREKRFIILTLRNVVTYVFGTIVTIILALLDFRYYAIMIGQVANVIALFLLLWIPSKSKFHFRLRFGELKRAFTFTAYLSGQGIINYVSTTIDNILVGKVLGNVLVGYYNKAYSLSTQPAQMLTSLISNTLQPLLTHRRDDNAFLFEKFLKIFKFMFIISIFIAGMFYVAPFEIVRILYGSQWGDAVPCLKYLSLGMTTLMLDSMFNTFFIVKNRVRLLYFTTTLTCVIVIGNIFVGVFGFKSINTLSILLSIALLIKLVITVVVLITKIFELHITYFLSKVWKELVLAGVVCVAALLYPFDIKSTIASLIVKAAYLGEIYLLALIFTKEYKILVDSLELNKFLAKITKKRTAAAVSRLR